MALQRGLGLRAQLQSLWQERPGSRAQQLQLRAELAFRWGEPMVRQLAVQHLMLRWGEPSVRQSAWQLGLNRTRPAGTNRTRWKSKAKSGKLNVLVA